MMKAPDSKYNASIPSVEPGEHLWVVMSMYRIHHPERMATETWHLDLENLISADGPICYLCEEPYRDGIESCGGDKYPYENTQR